MIKYRVLLLLAILLTSIVSHAQLRHGSCRSASQSRFYITPYIGAGGGTYSYDLNNTVVGVTPDSINYPTSKGTAFTPVLGLNLMYKVGRANIGGGFEWQGLYGTTSTDISDYKHSAYFYKFFGRLEYAIYTDPFSDFGIQLQAGLSFPNGTTGQTGDMGGFIAAGLFYSLIINSKSAIVFSADYEYAAFATKIGNSVSNHKFTPIKLAIGYRFWF
ncbi:MAG: hypothetical protein KAG84_04805 [Bacteroidales bacterium]|nr:hypothetical protein [Bacteroidales bacterium]